MHRWTSPPRCTHTNIYAHLCAHKHIRTPHFPAWASACRHLNSLAHTQDTRGSQGLMERWATNKLSKPPACLHKQIYTTSILHTCLYLMYMCLCSQGPTEEDGLCCDECNKPFSLGVMLHRHVQHVAREHVRACICVHTAIPRWIQPLPKVFAMRHVHMSMYACTHAHTRTHATAARNVTGTSVARASAERRQRVRRPHAMQLQGTSQGRSRQWCWRQRQGRVVLPLAIP